MCPSVPLLLPVGVQTLQFCNQEHLETHKWPSSALGGRNEAAFPTPRAWLFESPSLTMFLAE